MTKRVFEDAWNQALYDLGRDEQLEQVVEFVSNYTFLAFRDSGEKMAFIDRLKEAMRPNTQEES